MEITVDDLLHYPFSGLRFYKKMKIVLQGKPQPWLNWCTIYPDGRRLVFDKNSYGRISWLTGCARRNKLFCWPCLLFDTATIGSWNALGVSNSSLLFKDMSAHEHSPTHIQASLELKLFIAPFKNMASITVPKQKSIPRMPTELISINRELLKLVIDVVCNCAAKNQPPGSGICCRQLKSEDCVKMLHFVCDSSAHKISEIDSAMKLLKASPKHFNDVVDSITTVMKLSIKKETQMSTYVALILSEHSNDVDCSCISTVLRYLRNGKVYERFVGFFYLKHRSLFNVVYEHVSKVISEFNISERFIAYSLDGGVLETTSLSAFVTCMKDHYPFAFFVPWHAHELKKVLRQSLSNVKEYNIFFKTLTAVENFILKYSERWETFERLKGAGHFAKRTVPTSSDDWFIRTETTKVVCSHRTYFIEFLDDILQNSKSWDSEDIAQVSGFKQYLKQYPTVFLLHVFSRLFELISNFGTYLEIETPEQVFSCQNVLENLKDKLRREPTGYSCLYAKLLADCGKESPNPMAPNMTYFQQFHKIILVLVSELDVRFGGLRQLEFCSLLRHDVYVDRTVTDLHMAKLKKAHEPYFDFVKILSELQVLKANDSLIPKESVDALFDCFFEANLKASVPALYQLAELAMTLPIRQRPYGICATKLKNITNWGCTQEGAVHGDVSMICVELDFMKELKKSGYFYDAVMAKFFEVNKSIPVVSGSNFGSYFIV